MTEALVNSVINVSIAWCATYLLVRFTAYGKASIETGVSRFLSRPLILGELVLASTTVAGVSFAIEIPWLFELSASSAAYFALWWMSGYGRRAKPSLQSR